MTALSVLIFPPFYQVCLNFSLENFLTEWCQQSSRRPSIGNYSFAVAQDRIDDRITCQMPSSSLWGDADRLQGDWTISLWNDLLWHQARVRQRPLQAIQTRRHAGWWSRFKKELDKLGNEWKDRYGKKTLFCKKSSRAIIIALLIETFLSLFLPGEVLRLSNWSQPKPSFELIWIRGLHSWLRQIERNGASKPQRAELTWKSIMSRAR